jgi:signal transduction histidine kinase
MSAITVQAGALQAGTESCEADGAVASGEDDAVAERVDGAWRTGKALGPFAGASPGSLLTSRDIQAWLSPLAMIVMIGVTAGIVATGVPGGTAGASTVAMLVGAAALSAVGLSKRVRDLWVIVPALIGVGLLGTGLDWQAEGGPGFIAGYVSLMGLALRTPRRVAILAGVPVVAATAVEETYQSANPTTTILAVLFASGLLFITSAFAAISLDARQHAEALLEQEAATSEARQRAAALAERSRLARDLHDVLAHNLSALAVQLEATRLLAINMGAGSKLVGQVTSARQLTCIGMLEARRALHMLRDGETPGQASLPHLISETAATLGIPMTLEVRGVPRPLGGEAELTLYRVVQEALTNVAKHAGRGARAGVRLVWTSGGVEVSIADSGGDGIGAGLPSSGCGLSGMTERATLIGGRLHAGRSDDGFAVQLWLPARARPEPRAWPEPRVRPEPAP